MIKILITERGKKKRTITVNKTVATIGRIPKNDITLPKPNISKRHATLKLEGEQLIIDDNGSTNGTYVNGKRISAPQPIGPEDRIFIGDFVLKATAEEAGAKPTKQAEEAKPAPPEQQKKPEYKATLTQKAVDVAEVEKAAVSGKEELPPPPDEEELEIVLEDEDIVEEVEEIEAEVLEEPEQVKPQKEGKTEKTKPMAKSKKKTAEQAKDKDKENQAVLARDADVNAGLTDKVATIPSEAKLDAAGKDLEAYRLVLSEVAQRASKAVFKDMPVGDKEISDEEWSYYSDRLMQIVESMRRSNEIPSSIDPYVLSQDILSEYTGLGPLEEPLADEAVRAIHVTGCTSIFVLRGFQWERISKVFSSTAALTRVMAKLVKQANIKDVSARHYLRGRMDNGTLLQLLLPPLSGKHTIILEKGKASRLTLQDLLQAKSLDQKAVDLIKDAIDHDQNIIICGPKHSGKTVLLNALLSLMPLEANLVLLQGRSELRAPHVNTILVNKDNLDQEPTHAAFILDSISPDWVVFEDLDLNDVKVMLELIVSGRHSIIATLSSSDCQACLDRLVMELNILYPALTHTDRLRMIYSTIDLIISMERQPGIGSRVTRVTRLKMDKDSPGKEVLFGDK